MSTFLTLVASGTLGVQIITASILKLLGGLGAFLVAVKLISDAMNQLTNVGIKRLFQRMGKNKFAGVGMGALTSAVLHSSAVTTVMVVGFVNAGVMALQQAVTIIMGANIGTTFTALIAGFGASFDFVAYATIFTFVGILGSTICKKEKTKNIFTIIAGLGLIFVALQFMQMAVEPIKQSELIKQYIASLSNPFLMVFIGIVLTFVLQSSTALTTILISMSAVFCVDGGITNAVLFIILGSNIGTCFTTIIASVGATTGAKRAGLIHLLFNLFGSVLFFVILTVWQSFPQDTLARWFYNKPAIQIAIFHTIFNTLCTLLFMPFTNVFVKIATWLLPDKTQQEDTATKFLDERFLATPAIAIQQAKFEARSIGNKVMETCDLAFDAFAKTSVEEETVINNNLADISLSNKRLVQYLVSISAQPTVSAHGEEVVSSIYYIMGDLLRIGDLAQNVTKYTSKVANGEIVFSDKVYDEVSTMYSKVRSMYDEAMDTFINKDKKLLHVVQQHEDEIDEMRKQLVNLHIERLNNGECNPASNGVFINLVGNIERMADHITFIAESITKHPDSKK